MRIVIDLQAAQTPGSRHRGIGRYSTALAKAMLRQRGHHEILIALNGMFADTIAPLRESFEGLISPDAIRVWHATMPPVDLVHAPESHHRAAEMVRTSFLASLQPDVVHLTSLFESSGYAVTSAAEGPERLLTAVTLYDLIPHQYPDLYLKEPYLARFYGQKLDQLRRADLWLAISESSRREGIDMLGLDDSRVVNISSAADDHFTPGAVAAERQQALGRQYGLQRPFVMYTGGIDHRKNIEGLIGAWAALPREVRQAHQLAIVCSTQPNEKLRLEKLAQGSGLAPGELVLTGFVRERDLVDLYRLCKLFVFPSKHEGFGLPALEAMRCGAPVIGANNSSIPEVIGRADALFDAGSREAMADKMLACLQSEALRADLASHGLRQAQCFSWDTSARIALDAMERLVAQAAPAAAPRPATAAPSARPARPRLAFVSPMPPQRSGISDYSTELLPALAEHYEIDLVLDQPRLTGVPRGCYSRKRAASWFLRHGDEYDRVLYHFGNSPFHEYMLPLLERHPGTVVLHDFYLSGLQSYREIGAAKGPYWSRELYECHGWHALAQRFHNTDPMETIYAFPTNFQVLRQADGVIVHSPYSAELAREWYGADAANGWACIPHLRVALPRERDAAREQLQLESGTFLVCSFGLLNPTKMNHRLLSAWRLSALSRDPACRLVFVGENHAGEYGRKLLGEIESCEGRVSISGWAAMEDFRLYLNAADVAVQLRTMSRGETSGTVLDAMNHGVPVIANANGSMAHLPKEAVLLLDDEFSDEALAQALETLWRDEKKRRAMGEAGRRLIETQHSPAGCAAAYAQAIEAFAHARARGLPALIDQVGQVLRADATGPLLSQLASAIAVNMPLQRPARQVLIDVTGWVADGASAQLPPLVRGLIDHPVPGWRPEPVYQRGPEDWRYARGQVLRELGCPEHLLPDDPIEVDRHDLWCVLPCDSANTQPLPPPPRVRETGLWPLRLRPEANSAMVWAGLRSLGGAPGERRWFVDISELVQRDWQAGIQRVVKHYLVELLRNPPPFTRVIPVYATLGEPGYRVARRHLMQMTGIEDDVSPQTLLNEPWIDPQAGDLFFGLDLQALVIPRQAPFFESLRERGVTLAFMVYDLLPLRLPQCFVPEAADHHSRWLNVVAKADLAICISQAVADDVAAWLAHNPGAIAGQPPRIRVLRLGADFTASPPPEKRELSDPLLEQLRRRPSFLMVGTLEPRKGHAVVLAAFEWLWAQGHDAALVISGRPGWLFEPLVAAMRSHPELGKRLFWLENAGDEYLQQVYAASSCLVSASLGEGFGLPLVEAARHGLPIIARDLPVFRELAGEHAFYFQDDAPEALGEALLQWLALHREGRHPRSDDIPRQTWSQSAAQLRQLLLNHARVPDAAAC